MASPAVRTANTAASVAAHMPRVDQSVSLLVPLYEGPIETFVTVIYACHVKMIGTRCCW